MRGKRMKRWSFGFVVVLFVVSFATDCLAFGYQVDPAELERIEEVKRQMLEGVRDRKWKGYYVPAPESANEKTAAPSSGKADSNPPAEGRQVFRTPQGPVVVQPNPLGGQTVITPNGVTRILPQK